MESILLENYGINSVKAIKPYGNGLINETYLIETENQGKYIFQKINERVFKIPEYISQNIRGISEYLKNNYPDYLLPVPILSLTDQEYVRNEENALFRLIPFIPHSHTVDTVNSAEQAFEASKAFGRFSRLLAKMDISKVNITIPKFHDLDFRFNYFLNKVKLAPKKRSLEASDQIRFLLDHSLIVDKYRSILNNPAFKKRVEHHDTKISNVLFDPDEKALCVIDLDTVMPGYFISDLGDMIRTYVCAAGEEEQDLALVFIRRDFLQAVIEGYLTEMEGELNEIEKAHIYYSGEFMIYMQAIRFLTDYLAMDEYYKASYPLHNLNRAKHQITLLEQLFKLRKGKI